MMRILLATGEEAVYRTVDELALGISSGTVTAAARFFDFPSQGWRAIDAHPEYHQALARAALLVPASELEPLPAAPVAPERTEPAAGRMPIYQMFSLSAAELQAKRRPAWLLPAMAAVAAIGMLLSVLTVLWAGRKTPHQAAEHESSLSSKLPSATSSTLPATLTSVEAMRLAPVNLNSHQAYAMEAAGRVLGDTAAALGLTGLLHPVRLTTPDSIRRIRNRLQVLRGLIVSYRATQRTTAEAYRDTANLLTRTGFWSRIDQQEWKVFPSALESPEDASRADSLLGTLDRLYTLLSAQGAAYRNVAGRVQLGDSARAAEYERLRAALSQLEGAGNAGADRPPSALTVLRRAIRVPSSSGATPP